MIVQTTYRPEVMRERFEREVVIRCLSKGHSERLRSSMELSKLLMESRTPEWGQENASRGRAYLPASSWVRTARPEFVAEPISSLRTRSYFAK